MRRAWLSFSPCGRRWRRSGRMRGFSAPPAEAARVSHRRARDDPSPPASPGPSPARGEGFRRSRLTLDDTDHDRSLSAGSRPVRPGRGRRPTCRRSRRCASAALGKQGSVSALLKTLGAMSPEERKARGPAINSLRDRVAAAIAERKAALEAAGARRAAGVRAPRPHPARAAAAQGLRPSHHAGDGRDDHGLRRARLRRRRRAGHRGRLPQLHGAELPARAPGARDARHLLLRAGRAGEPHAAAHPHLAGAGAHHDEPEAADPDRRAGPDLPEGFRPDPHARCSTRSRAW